MSSRIALNRSSSGNVWPRRSALRLTSSTASEVAVASRRAITNVGDATSWIASSAAAAARMLAKILTSRHSNRGTPARRRDVVAEREEREVEGGVRVPFTVQGNRERLREREREREDREREHGRPDGGAPVDVAEPGSVLAREEAGGARGVQEAEAREHDEVHLGERPDHPERAHLVGASVVSQDDCVRGVHDDVDEMGREHGDGEGEHLAPGHRHGADVKVLEQPATLYLTVEQPRVDGAA